MPNSHHFSLIISHLNDASCTPTVTCIIHYPIDKEEILALIIELKNSNTLSIFLIFVWAGIICNTISQGQHWKNESGQNSISLFNKNKKAKDKSSFSKYFTRLFTDIE